MINETAAGERRDNDGRDPAARSPTIAFRWRGVIPYAAIFIIGDDDQHMRPLRAFFQMPDDVGNMRIARLDIRVAGMLVQITLRFVEGNLRQSARIDCLDESGSG